MDSDGERRRRFKRRLRGLLVLTGLLLALATWYSLTAVLPRVYRADLNPELEREIRLESLSDPVILQRLDELARLYLSRPENAGIVIGVTIQGRRLTLARGVASRSRDAGAVSAETLFEIGSITKPFTGIALAQAVLNDEIELDQPIDSILEPAVSIPGLRERPITPLDLATHHSGLPRLPPTIRVWNIAFSDNPYRGFTEEDLFEALAQSVERAPGEPGYAYSNYGFILLARVLEHATGLTYAELIEQRIAAPLGMLDTRVLVTGPRRQRLADGHSRGKTMDHWLEDRLPGSGGIASSCNDMLTWIEAYLDPDDNPLREAFDLAIHEHRNRRPGRSIGLGWGIAHEHDRLRRIGHSGGSVGFRSYAGFLPDAGVGVVVLANSNDHTARALGQRLLNGLGLSVSHSPTIASPQPAPICVKAIAIRP